MCQGVGLAFRTVTVALFHRHGGLESPCNWPFQPGICKKAVQRGARIASCRSSGLTVRQWCSENGISAGSYYKWQRRLYQMTAGDSPQFIEVTPHQPARDPSAVIHIRDTEVEILPGIDVNTLETICRVLKTC